MTIVQPKNRTAGTINHISKFADAFLTYLRQRDSTWNRVLPGRTVGVLEENIQLGLFMKAEQGREKQLFFKPILNAWNAIAFDRYEPDSNAFRSACHILTGNYGRIASPHNAFRSATS